ncbi:hypothetical protein SLS62_007144 [Diatrype stigma]|uniref:Ubiquitin-like domain-containing protein n=1 Tax=Diatrype stigma TaxID=117547 RepID=A0AAN9UN47_9PEZI
MGQGSLESSPVAAAAADVAAEEKEWDEDTRQVHPRAVAQDQTGEATTTTTATPSLVSGNSSAEIRQLDPGPEGEGHKQEQCARTLTLLSVQGAGSTGYDNTDNARSTFGSLHDGPGSNSDSDCCRSSHKGKAAAASAAHAAVTETSPLTLLSPGGAVAAVDHRQQMQDTTAAAPAAKVTTVETTRTTTSHIKQPDAAAVEPHPPLLSFSGSNNCQEQDQQQQREQKQKQLLEAHHQHEGQTPEVQSSPSLTTTTTPEISTSSPPPPSQPPPHPAVAPPPPFFQSLQVGDPGWERSADRPPKKLPIRFKDAYGKHYVFPWERARTWDGMKGFIDSCFSHVDVNRPRVIAGQYDLLTSGPFSTGLEGLHAGAIGGGAVPTSSTTTAAFPPSPAAAPPTPAAPSLPSTPGTPDPEFTILPGVWEDMIEPGRKLLI